MLSISISLFKSETNRGSELLSVFTSRSDRSSRSFNLHNPMAREERPLGRKCLASRKDHRKSVRPLRNAGKETRRRNEDAKKTGRMGKMLLRGVGGKDGRGEKGRRRARKWGGERIKRRERSWLASAKTPPLYHQRRTVGGIDKILPCFLPFFLPSSFFFFFQRMRLTTYMSGGSGADLIFLKHCSSMLIIFNCNRKI